MFDADYTLGTHRWHVVRLSSGSKTEVVVLSQQFFAVTTHWVGRTVLCSGDECVLCDLLPSRGLFYLAVFCAGQTRLLELGAQSASHLEQHCKLLHGGLRAGLVLELSRRGAKQPVHSEVVRFQAGAESVPLLLLATRVMALYKFPPPNSEEALVEYEVRVRRCCNVRNVRLAKEFEQRHEKPRV